MKRSRLTEAGRFLSDVLKIFKRTAIVLFSLLIIFQSCIILEGRWRGRLST